jgi:hypothetical protein
MGHPRDADELLEVSGDELQSVVGDDPWFYFRILLPSSLQNDFDFLSLANCYFAHDSSGFPCLATILRCCWSFFLFTSSPPWPGCSDLTASVP